MILVTGGYGCIGAEVVKWLLRNTSDQVLLISRRVSEARTERVFRSFPLERLRCEQVDIGDPKALQSLFREHELTHIAHLAALQTPDCNADKHLGLQINLAGTQFLLEAAREQLVGSLQRIVYASSIAVYGPRKSYSGSQVPESAQPNPVNVYGIWKLASEHLTKLFSEECGVPTINIRPAVLFGPGRDLGLTSAPTSAMKAIALGEPYQIPFRSKQDYSYAPDVGAAFGHALTQPFSGHATYTLPSSTLAMSEVVSEMQAAAQEVGLADKFKISFGSDDVPFICDLEFGSIRETFPDVPKTNFRTAVANSLSFFHQEVQQGRLTADQLRP